HEVAHVHGVEGPAEYPDPPSRRSGNHPGCCAVVEGVMSDSVGQYLNEIGMVPLLNAEEERQLSQIIEKGREAQQRIDEGEQPGRELRRAVSDAAAAKDRFIRANLRLVVSIARRYPLPPSMELLDLIQ